MNINVQKSIDKTVIYENTDKNKADKNKSTKKQDVEY